MINIVVDVVFRDEIATDLRGSPATCAQLRSPRTRTPLTEPDVSSSQRIESSGIYLVAVVATSQQLPIAVDIGVPWLCRRVVAPNGCGPVMGLRACAVSSRYCPLDAVSVYREA